MPQLSLPGGKGRTEKYIRAEQKNRLERTRLELNHKFYDREAFKTKFRIDREKKLVLRAFNLVKRTSGASDEGCAPLNEYDREHEKSEVFTTGLRLTELRLNHWRHVEKELLSYLESIERDMEKMSPTTSQKDRFLSQENYCHLLMKGIGLTPTDRPLTSVGLRPRPRPAHQRTESVYSYGYSSDSDELSDESDSLSSVSSTHPSLSSRTVARSELSSVAESKPKKVSFARPQTAVGLTKRKALVPQPLRRSQTPNPTQEESTHFLITKGGVLMHIGGEYKPIHVKKKEVPNTTTTTATTPPALSAKGKLCSMVLRLKELQNENECPPSPTETSRGTPSGKSPTRRVLSPCSENSSVVFNYTESPRIRSAPSPIGNLPKRLYPPTGRANSRLGIFLPPEKEFSKRQHFSNRKLNESAKDLPQQVTEEQANAWKNRLIQGQSSHANIRSMRSLATVLRAALAFSRKRRRSILKDMVAEKSLAEKQI